MKYGTIKWNSNSSIGNPSGYIHQLYFNAMPSQITPTIKKIAKTIIPFLKLPNKAILNFQSRNIVIIKTTNNDKAYPADIVYSPLHIRNSLIGN